MNVNYQKPNTGFRIGISIAMVILMLGIVIALNVFTTHMITGQVKIMSDFNIPMTSGINQMYSIQQIQHFTFKDSLTYQKLSDIKNYELTKGEFYSYNNEFDYQIEKLKNLTKINIDEQLDENTNRYLNLLITNLKEIDSLHSESVQMASQIFHSYDNDKTKKQNFMVDTFENEQNQLSLKELLLNDEVQKFTTNSKSDVIDSEQRTLTLQIVIMISAGIISLALVYFLNQINKDLTREVIRKTRSLQRANKKLRRLDSLKDDFINIASHELKSPLNPIYGFVELAQNGDIEKDEAILGISKLVRQLEEVANRILDMSRIDKKRLQLSYEKFNFSELIMEIVTTYRINLNDKIKIETDIEKGIEVEADRIRISQVIRNLLNNALKFTSEGQILITTHYDKQRNSVDVNISDDGSGIHSDILPNLFNKFITKGPSMEPWQGNGLGLYLCRGIIDAHGGYISAHNNKTSGATIRFTIPIIRHENVKKVYQEIVN